MSAFSDEFVSLVCPQCGGKMTIEKEKFNAEFVEKNRFTFIYIGQGETIKCEHCATEFVRRESYRKGGSTVINTGGGAYIGGTVIMNGGDFIGGDLVMGSVILGDKIEGRSRRG